MSAAQLHPVLSELDLQLPIDFSTFVASLLNIFEKSSISSGISRPKSRASRLRQLTSDENRGNPSLRRSETQNGRVRYAPLLKEEREALELDREQHRAHRNWEVPDVDTPASLFGRICTIKAGTRLRVFVSTVKPGNLNFCFFDRRFR